MTNMASWDDEEFEPTEASAGNTSVVKDKWDGEDEEDDAPDNWWSDEEGEEKNKENVPKSQPKKKKTLSEKIAEKEEKLKEERRQESLRRLQEQEDNRELTAEEKKKMQEESDLELAMDTFGVAEDHTPAVLPDQRTIDNFTPTNKEEFNELSKMIVQKLAKLEWRVEYGSFLEATVRDACAGCEPDVIKKISSTLNSLATEKQKLIKEKTKGKKKTGAAANKTLKTGKGVKGDMDYGDDYGYGDFDDFM